MCCGFFLSIQIIMYICSAWMIHVHVREYNTGFVSTHWSYYHNFYLLPDHSWGVAFGFRDCRYLSMYSGLFIALQLIKLLPIMFVRLISFEMRCIIIKENNKSCSVPCVCLTVVMVSLLQTGMAKLISVPWCSINAQPWWYTRINRHQCHGMLSLGSVHSGRHVHSRSISNVKHTESFAVYIETEQSH